MLMPPKFAPRRVMALAICLALSPAAARADPVPGLYGAPGLIDMPTADMTTDGTVTLGMARLPESLRFSAGFQAVPRVNLTFRYSGIGDLGGYVESSGYSLWDRSLDMRVLLWPETPYRPALAVGVRDILGTGVLASEYLVATKQILPSLSVTAGLGWGRLGTANTIGATGNRPAAGNSPQGGRIRLESLFRGDVGLFGGLRWTTSVDGVTLAVEYGSDDYSAEASFGVAPTASRWSAGVDWTPRPGTHVGLHMLNGTGLAFSITTLLNPRGPDISAKPAWESPKGVNPVAAFEGSGIVPLALGRTGDECRATITIGNVRSAAVATDRAGRALLAQGCTTGRLRIAHEGMVFSETRLDLTGDAPIVLSSGAASPAGTGEAALPRLDWSVSPLIRVSLFDPDQPLYHDLSLAAAASYRFTPGLSLSGQVSHTVTGNFDRITRGPKGSLPPVRTNIARYLNEQGPRLDHLTLDLFQQHSAQVYSRLSAGYLETMYAGLSAEVYARHARLPLAAALEVNLVRARDFDQGLGLRDLPELAKVNGHASFYWHTGFQGFEMQLDVGRYLAGDLGATLSVSRDFRNGWEIGAFATLTDASSAEFGEGSFDKGIFFRVPLAIVWPRETGLIAEQRISSLTGDGGQRLSIRNRLHDIVANSDSGAVLAGCIRGVPCFTR